MKQDKKIYILGEVHGAKENPDIVSNLIKKLGVHTLCFEWSPEWFTENFEPIPACVPKDGRFTKEYYDFFRKIKDLYQIIFVDLSTAADSWNSRELIMASKVRSAFEESKSNTLFVTGRLHAGKTPFTIKSFSKEKLNPVSYLLEDKKPIAIKINYCSGEIYNFGIKKIKEKCDTGFGYGGLFKSKGKAFDHEICVEKAHPASILEKTGNS